MLGFTLSSTKPGTYIKHNFIYYQSYSFTSSSKLNFYRGPTLVEVKLKKNRLEIVLQAVDVLGK